MTTYLMQYTYKPETWATLVKNPQNRREAVNNVVAQIGGKLIGCWFGLDDHGLYVIAEAPEPINVAAGSMLVAASGAFNTVRTTVLLSMEECFSAMQKAGTMSYKPPS